MQMQVMSGPERRRRWSDDQKRAIVAASFAPGAVVSDVARRADVCANLIYRWRQEFGASANKFAELVVTDDRAPIGTPPESVIVIEFRDRALVRLPMVTSPGLASAILKALR